MRARQIPVSLKSSRRYATKTLTLVGKGQASLRPVRQSLKQIPKRDFNVDVVLAKIRTAIKPFRKAALFELFDSGCKSLFEQLVACIISIRTMDEVTVPTAKKLFEVARVPEAIAKMRETQIDRLIHSCAFHEAKAKTIRQIAQAAIKKHAGALPCDRSVLLELPGVGPKCANLALGIVCGQGGIGVDVHVHRVTNRWGYVQANTPEQTMAALEAKLPRKYWVEINRLLVPFGKHVCTGINPKCSTCPVLDMCQQVGVTNFR
ncbi:MAG TPA: endonuclease III [Verrucomicrobiae bacterium]|jgi:endonuclease-3